MERQRIREGRYALHALLGEGAQGSTFDAVDVREGRPVAVKRFDVRGARSWKDLELAERETRVLANLSHPLVPRYVEHFEEDGALYLVMEKVEGETLESMQRRGIFGEAEARRFLECAASALGYLHGLHPPVIHRDIKPRNVIRRPDGSYVFVDFGAVSERMRLRGGSTVVGTVGFMAPEQFQGRTGPGTDVYAVAATAIAGLAGVDPEVLPHRGLALDVRAALGRRASPGLVNALERMAEPDPDVRPKTVVLPSKAEKAGDPVHTRGDEPKPKKHKVPPTPEDALVRSIRRLLWVLWALGWPIVGPLVQSPLPMLVWMAAVLIVTWHDNAIVRAIVRRWGWGQGGAMVPMDANAPPPIPEARLRVEEERIRRAVRLDRPEPDPELVSDAPPDSAPDARRRAVRPSA